MHGKLIEIAETLVPAAKKAWRKGRGFYELCIKAI